MAVKPRLTTVESVRAIVSKFHAKGYYNDRLYHALVDEAVIDLDILATVLSELKAKSAGIIIQPDLPG